MTPSTPPDATLAGRKPFNMLMSFPRSGTDFFCAALCHDTTVKYFREYFNPVCNPRRAAVLGDCFGDERDTHVAGIMRETSCHALRNVFQTTWQQDGFNTTKENYSALKVGFFVERFNMIMLMRKPSHTIPSSVPHYLVAILQSFLGAADYTHLPLAQELNELRRFLCRTRVQNVAHACLLAYLVQHFVLLHWACAQAIPILFYEDLLTDPPEALRARLGCLELFDVNPDYVTDHLVRTRPAHPTTYLAARSAQFHAAIKSEWRDVLVEFLIGLSPGIAPGLERLVS